MNRQYDKQDIAQLLSKFMAGTTSLDEEQVLAQYFRTHEVGEDWKEYQEMFALFDSGEVEVHPQPLHKGGELLSSGNEQIRVPFRWGVVRGGLLAVAASVLLLLVFHYSREVDKEKPVTARVETQSASRPTPAPSRQGGETSGLQEDDTAQPRPSLMGGVGGGSAGSRSSKSLYRNPADKKHRKTAGKQSAAVEPVPAEAEPAAETLPVDIMEAYAMTVEPTHDAYADIEAEMRDIRSRGERFEAMVAEFTRSY
ncbi:MAG: hypothetical protein IJ767_00940 [Bacteroidaceae bacterium]|nr:hypothetical protein [Bacteroidaceae bacterium]